MPKEVNSPFKDYIVPMPSPGAAGDWGGTTNGAEIRDGQKATEGIWGPEVTFVSVDGAPGVGEQVTQDMIANTPGKKFPPAK